MMEAEHLFDEVPVIDFSLLSMRDESELKKMDKALQEWGFFQMVNHGVEKEVIDNMKEAAKEFFELPLEEKAKYAKDPTIVQGFRHTHLGSPEHLVLFVHPPQHHQLLEYYWPKSSNYIKEVIGAYTDGIRKVGEELLRSISLLMGMNEETIINLHGELMQTLRLNYYPPCSKSDQVLGLSPHSDANTITLLLQQEDIVALQVKHHGKWIPVNPIPNALVVNAGDTMEILSNGKYQSIEHRVVMNAEKTRISYASFLSPHLDVDIEPLLTSETTNCIKKYRKIKYGEYVKIVFKKLEGKSVIDMLRIES